MPTFDALSLIYTVGIVLVVIVAVRFVERQINGHYSVNVSSCEEQIAAMRAEYELEIAKLRERVDFLLAELQRSGIRIAELKKKITEKTSNVFRLERKSLLVALASDVAGWMDLAATRAQPVGLTVSRINGVTKARLKRYIDRGRMYNRPVELLHIGAHAGANGIRFDDEIADDDWLSEHLAGVRVLLIAGCSADTLGDWLGVVPYVVTMAEDVADDDAAKFARAFWAEIGAGNDPDTALNAAFVRAPSGMEEYVERHW